MLENKYKAFKNIFLLFLVEALSIVQLKKLSTLADEQTKKCNEQCAECEAKMFESLKEIGNLLHESVVISNDEVKCYIVTSLIDNNSYIYIYIYEHQLCFMAAQAKLQTNLFFFYCCSHELNPLSQLACQNDLIN